MGRIITSVSIENLIDVNKSITWDALVDSVASYMVLPAAWQEQLGDFPVFRTVELQTATQVTIEGRVCGPVKIQVEGFDPISSEVLFVKMEPQDGVYEPLLGYIPLEQSQAAVEIQGDRLMRAKRMDLK